MRFGFAELAIILVIVLLFTGGKQLPKLAQSFKKSKEIIKEETARETDTGEDTETATETKATATVTETAAEEGRSAETDGREK